MDRREDSEYSIVLCQNRAQSQASFSTRAMSANQFKTNDPQPNKPKPLGPHPTGAAARKKEGFLCSLHFRPFPAFLRVPLAPTQYGEHRVTNQQKKKRNFSHRCINDHVLFSALPLTGIGSRAIRVLPRPTKSPRPSVPVLSCQTIVLRSSFAAKLPKRRPTF